MTVIIALPFFRHLVIIADSRVSYKDTPGVADDILQKLYPFGNSTYGFRTVLGFSGPLKGACRVLERVGETAKSYSKPAVASTLVNDLVRWIKYEYQQLQPDEREGLSFLLAAVEPSRDRSVKKPDWIPFQPVFRSLTLKPSTSTPSKLVVEERKIIKAIGVYDKEFLETLKDIMRKHYGFQFKHPEFGMQIVIDELMIYFRKREGKHHGIGGLFQCANLGVEGLKFLSYGSVGDITMKFVKGRYIQKNKTTGKTVPLMSLSEWCRLEPPPGNFGIFENPYQDLLDKQSGEDETPNAKKAP